MIEAKGYAKAVEIAQRLQLKGPSVTRMVQKLSRDGFLKYEKYRGIVMTRQGRATAADMRRRHHLIRKFLMGLGVDAQTANADADTNHGKRVQIIGLQCLKALQADFGRL